MTQELRLPDSLGISYHATNRSLTPSLGERPGHLGGAYSGSTRWLSGGVWSIITTPVTAS